MSSKRERFSKQLARVLMILERLRVNGGSTQVELSNRLGVFVVHISTLENGHALPSIELLRAYNSIRH
jgi:transcriptional regulator with XRE-family HTH domain